MISDAVWAEEHGLSTVWIPQVPDEFDAMTAAALIAQVDVAYRDRHGGGPAPVAAPGRVAAAVAVDAAGRAGPVHPRPRAVAPLDHRGHARPAVRTSRGAHEGLPRRPRRGDERAGTGRRRERALHDPQPDERHRRAAHAGDARRARPRDAATRRVAHRRNDPVDGRREGDRVAHRATHHRRRDRSRPTGTAHRRRCAGVPVSPRRGRRGEGPADRVLSEATMSPNYQRLLDQGNATGVSDILASATRRWSGRGSLRSPRQASPTSRSASCRSAKAARNSSSRAAAPANSSPPSPPTTDLVHWCQAPIPG